MKKILTALLVIFALCFPYAKSIAQVNNASSNGFTNEEGKVFIDFIISERKKSEADINEYIELLKDAGWPTIFDLNRIKADENLRESISILRAAEDASNDFIAYQEYEASALEERISQLKTTGRVKKLLRNTRAHPELKRLNKRALEIEREIIAQAVQFFIHLSLNKSWEIKAGFIAFDNYHDQNRLNGYYSQIDRLTSEQASLKIELSKVYEQIALINQSILKQ